MLKKLRTAPCENRVVLVRCDLNLPMAHGVPTDLTRLERLLPTVHFLLARKAKPLLLSHRGRPKGLPSPDLSLKSLSVLLATQLQKPVHFYDGPLDREKVVASCPEGGLVLLENLRFFPGEEANSEAFSSTLASLGDLFVNDAFSVAHRTHASVVGLAYKLPSYAGLALCAEVEALTSALVQPDHPLVAVVGGAKMSTKLPVLSSLAKKVDHLIVGGGIANTLLKAQGMNVGKSLIERENLPEAKALLEEAGDVLILPQDVVVAPSLEAADKSRVCAVQELESHEMILDIGPHSCAHNKKSIENAQSLVWNGPLGAFETPPFEKGTLSLAKDVALATEKGLLSVVGGGDTLAALNKVGGLGSVSHVSTGGGAFLKWIEDPLLPGLVPLDESSLASP